MSSGRPALSHSSNSNTGISSTQFTPSPTRCGIFSANPPNVPGSATPELRWRV
ncbi:hypothetical protein [Umezawaea tangerina]|uniref:hypothetical protein n=1 Tax=Umezawaea tangerina TaxID=84725 RepID=UPI001FE779E1|nr:hypothetical protein [Umezawaea tangerina]